MTDKLDPVFMEDWACYLTEMAKYAIELMKMSGYGSEEMHRIVDRLVFPAEPHSFVIDRDRARKMGIKISNSERDSAFMKVMKAWLTGYMLTESQKHIIRYILPRNGGSNGRTKAKRTGAKRNATK